MRERQKLEEDIASCRQLQTGLDDAIGLIELAEEEEDQSVVDEAVAS